MKGVGSKSRRLQPGSFDIPHVMARPLITFTYRGDPSALRKSRATGTIGASIVVVPPLAGAFPSVLNSQLLRGWPFALKPGVEYAPLKLGTESMPGMPGSVACCVPFSPAGARLILVYCRSKFFVNVLVI